MSYTLRAISEELMGKANKAKDAALYLQIKELVDRGLLVVEETQPVLVKNPDTSEFTVQTMVKLTVRDMEYIERLEEEVAKLKKALHYYLEKSLKDGPHSCGTCCDGDDNE